MILDPQSGITLRQVFEYLCDIAAQNKPAIEEFAKDIESDYEVPDDVLDSLEHKESYTPDDIRTLARAVGMDYDLLTSDELPEDFNDRFNTAVDNLYKLRNMYKHKPEADDGSTDNPTA